MTKRESDPTGSEPGCVTASNSSAEPLRSVGIVEELGRLGASAIITEEGVARLFNRHLTSVKRAVRRGELPPPYRLFGKNSWTVRILVRHIEEHLEQAARDAENLAAKVRELSP